MTETYGALDVLFDTSGGISASRSDGMVSRAAAPTFLRDYEESVAAALMDRQEGDTLWMARLPDSILTSRKNSLMCTSSAGAVITV